MAGQIAGIETPDSKQAREATEVIRDTTPPLVFHHARRVHLSGSLGPAALGIRRVDFVDVVENSTWPE